MDYKRPNFRKLKRPKSIIWTWYCHPNQRNLPYLPKSVIFALKQYARHYPLPDYGYEGDWKTNLEYVCDRMNGGRAMAILRLYNINKA